VEGYMDADKQLVKRILNGDTECFNDLINKYFPRTVGFIYKMGVVREDAEDLAQEVFIKVYNNLYKYNESWKFSTWLFKIAVNTYKDFRKRKQPRTEEINENIPSGGASPEEYLDSVQRQESIRLMFSSLNDDVKSIMVLHYYQGLSLKEIGEIYRISPDAVKMKIFRARKQLSKKYGRNALGGESYEMQV